MYTISDFSVGDKVLFGRRHGEKTLGKVIKVNRKNLKVEQLEERGCYRNYSVGTKWTVPPSLCTPVAENGRPADVPSEPVPSADEIRNTVLSIASGLSPENLSCDGEASRAWQRRRLSQLLDEFRSLERRLGRSVVAEDLGDDRFDRMALEEIHAYTRPRRSTYSPTQNYDFKVNDSVSFTAKGRKIVGKVKRVNRKTVAVMPNGERRHWRVSPGLLTKEN